MGSSILKDHSEREEGEGGMSASMSYIRRCRKTNLVTRSSC